MDNKENIDTLQELLKGEHMAIHIYDKTKNIQGDGQVMEMLGKFQQEHQKHAEQLSNRIKELGGQPNEGTGMAGMMAGVSSVINSIRGPEELLKQVYDGEDKGIHSYEDRVDDLDPVSQELVRTIMSEDHEHLKFFKARMEKEKVENKDKK